MLTCVFTLDYEIFGSGKGTLAEHVLAPAERLADLFRAAGKRFVLYPEVAELEAITEARTDPDAGRVAPQVRTLHLGGFEVGLHFHPWWHQARHDGRDWVLDYSQYNLCTLPPATIADRVDRALGCLRGLVGDQQFTPLSYRAGHLLMQPAGPVVDVLTSRGIGIDSSVFKGGLWREHSQDYRPALKLPPTWRFDEDPSIADPAGRMLEVPVHAEMVATWRMLTGKRLSLERRSAGVSRSAKRVLDRLRGFTWRRAVKFDYCVLEFKELEAMLEAARREDERDASTYRPVVAIGHTKDLLDLGVVERLLEYLDRHHIEVSTFEGVRRRCSEAGPKEVAVS